jgi:hypothetical protein
LTANQNQRIGRASDRHRSPAAQLKACTTIQFSKTRPFSGRTTTLSPGASCVNHDRATIYNLSTRFRTQFADSLPWPRLADSAAPRARFTSFRWRLPRTNPIRIPRLREIWLPKTQAPRPYRERPDPRTIQICREVESAQRRPHTDRTGGPTQAPCAEKLRARDRLSTGGKIGRREKLGSK